MPQEGTYLLTNVGFSPSEEPCITLQREGSFFDLLPLSKTIDLQFDNSQRYCVGWRNITTGERSACPTAAALDGKYEQCAACQERTGFNPAFYHATSVSTQQEARNQEPHILYLARFGNGIIKVGISYAKRGRSRLLEQGARDALILDTFPSANIARQYEAKIAALPNIVETLQVRKKLSLILQPYSHQDGEHELQATKQKIEEALKISFEKPQLFNLDPIYFPHDTPNLADSVDCTDQNKLTGTVNGSVGSLLFCLYNETPVFLPLKKYVGYNVELAYTQTQLSLPARQTSLF
ncbi:MAG TPA: DUF2797 domain-containing protein [Candidatus Saccharimonadales bacterium]